jgi:hypothetical protein
MDRENLLQNLESALMAEDWKYVQELQSALLSIGDKEALARMDSILKKAHSLKVAEDNNNKENLIKSLESSLLTKDYSYVNAAKELAVALGDEETVHRINLTLEKYECQEVEVEPKLVLEKKPVISLSDSLPQPRLALRMRDQARKIENGKLSIYEMPKTREIEDQNKKLYKYSIGQSSQARTQEKVLMVVGETGAGKTTLINGMINYILGVQWEDDFRFKLIKEEGGKSQAHSQTQSITAFTIHQMEGSPLSYTLTIIDTPGFGDTEGLKKDIFITSQIKEFFSMQNGIDHLNGIGFIEKSSGGRLTSRRRYIFDAILSIFGKDMVKNIFLMINFCDGAPPPVLEAVKEAGIPFQKYFQFNNSALFSEEKDNRFPAMFWEMGFESFKEFFNDFEKSDSISLRLTEDVLEERKKLETTVNGLLPQIEAAQLKLNEFLREEAMLLTYKDQIEANKNFTWVDMVSKQRKVDLPRGVHTTNCLKCNATCHLSCAYANDNDKYKCSAMDGGGITNAVCRVCKCSWRDHCNNPYRFEVYQEQVTKTYDTIKARYESGIEGKTTVEGIIQSLNTDLECLCAKIFCMIQEVQQCLHRLDEIALKPNPLTQIAYIDQLIVCEKREAKFGWDDRVKYYQSARDFAVALSRTKDAAEIEKTSDIKEWAKNLISRLKNEKIQEIEVVSRKSSKGNTTKNRGSWVEDFARKIFDQ